MDDEGKQTDPNLPEVSRRHFLVMMAAGMGTFMPVFPKLVPVYSAPAGNLRAEFASWGENLLTYDSLVTPYMDLGDWKMQFLPMVSKIG